MFALFLIAAVAINLVLTENSDLSKNGLKNYPVVPDAPHEFQTGYFNIHGKQFFNEHNLQEFIEKLIHCPNDNYIFFQTKDHLFYFSNKVIQKEKNDSFEIDSTTTISSNLTNGIIIIKHHQNQNFQSSNNCKLYKDLKSHFDENNNNDDDDTFTFNIDQVDYWIKWNKNNNNIITTSDDSKIKQINTFFEKQKVSFVYYKNDKDEKKNVNIVLAVYFNNLKPYLVNCYDILKKNITTTGKGYYCEILSSSFDKVQLNSNYYSKEGDKNEAAAAAENHHRETFDSTEKGSKRSQKKNTDDDDDDNTLINNNNNKTSEGINQLDLKKKTTTTGQAQQSNSADEMKPKSKKKKKELNTKKGLLDLSKELPKPAAVDPTSKKIEQVGNPDLLKNDDEQKSLLNNIKKSENSSEVGPQKKNEPKIEKNNSVLTSISNFGYFFVGLVAFIVCYYF